MGPYLHDMGVLLLALLVTGLYGSVLGLVFCGLRRLFGTGLNARARMLGWRLLCALLLLVLLSCCSPFGILHSLFYHQSGLFRNLVTELARRFNLGELAPALSWPWQLTVNLLVFNGAYPAPVSDDLAAGHAVIALRPGIVPAASGGSLLADPETWLQAGPEGWGILRLWLQRPGGEDILWEWEGMQWLIPVLLGLWLAGLLFFWLRRALGYVRLMRLLRDVPDCKDPAITDEVRKEAGYRGITDYIAVKLLPEPLPRLGVVSPCAVGFRDPMLVLPLSQWERLSPAEREAVIAHEVFHIKKRDNWRNLWLLLLESLLWFAPAVRFALRRLRQDLEYLRDRQLIREPLTPAAARDYARALVSVASRSCPYRPALHCGMLTGCGLGLRVGLLAEAEGRKSRLLTALYLLLTLALLLLALLLRGGLRPILLQVIEVHWVIP